METPTLSGSQFRVGCNSVPFRTPPSVWVTRRSGYNCQEALGVLPAVEAILGTGVIAVRKHLISRRQSQPATYVLGFNSRIDKEVAVRIQNASSFSCNEKQNHDTFWIICPAENHDGK